MGSNVQWNAFTVHTVRQNQVIGQGECSHCRHLSESNCNHQTRSSIQLNKVWTKPSGCPMWCCNAFFVWWKRAGKSSRTHIQRSHKHKHKDKLFGKWIPTPIPQRNDASIVAKYKKTQAYAHCCRIRSGNPDETFAKRNFYRKHRQGRKNERTNERTQNEVKHLT